MSDVDEPDIVGNKRIVNRESKWFPQPGTNTWIEWLFSAGEVALSIFAVHSPVINQDPHSYHSADPKLVWH